MMAMPVVIVLIVGTAFLTAIVSASLPRMGKWFNAFKSRIKRKSNATDIVDVILTNLAEVKYNRDRNRKSNIKRDVREYLKELQNTK